MLNPRSIAIIGASGNYHRNTGRIMVNLQKSSYEGELFLINPKYDEISGVKCYPSILDIEEDIDPSFV